MGNFKLIVLLINAYLTAFPCLSEATLDRQCLDCMCQASSECKPNIRCHNTGAGQYFCGPYQISWAYWADSGKPGYTGFSNDFENCLVNKNCAEATVRGYMNKWASDCNNDGRVDCFDYAAIHKAGPTGCNQPWLLNSKYWNEFRKCYQNSPSTLTARRNPLRITSSNSRTNTIIEIPKPISRPLPTFGASSDIPVGSLVSSSSYSSSFSRQNYTHSRIEVSENIASDMFPTANRILPSSFNDINKPLSPLISVTSINPKPLSTPVISRESRPIIVKPRPIPVETLIAQPSPNINNQLVSGDCLQCLCQASSKCDLNKGCNGAYCGPYLLSWGYWADGGQPQKDYPTCAKDKSCSELAIQGYMAKWQKDCNRDGQVDCLDFALIHKLGPHGCGKLQAIQVTDYWNNFMTCYQSSSPGITRSQSERSVSAPSTINLLPVSSPVSDRLIGPIKPSSIGPISTPVEQPSIEIQPLKPSVSNYSFDSFGTQPEAPSVRITFNNRDIVNTFHESDLAPMSNRSPPSLTEIPQPNVNLNSIVSSPLRPTFSSYPFPARPQSLPTSRPIRPIPRNDPNLAPDSRPVVPTRESNVDALTNDNVFAQPRLKEQPLENSEILDEPFSPSSGSIPSAPTLTSTSLDRFKVNTNTNMDQISNASRSVDTSLVSQECIECICHASSKCNPSIGCVSDGTGKFICGPYQVDWEYWTEAGKPGNRADLSNLENFQMCLNNRECADKTVRGYIKKYQKDCNEDGIVDCNDFAAVHVAGPNHCNAQWYLDSKYYSDFRECFDFRR